MSADDSAGPLPPGGLNELAGRLSKPQFGHPVQATDDFCECTLPGTLREAELDLFSAPRGRRALISLSGSSLRWPPQGSGCAPG